eukprot:6232546-Prymnesium_polylepis.1
METSRRRVHRDRRAFRRYFRACRYARTNAFIHYSIPARSADACVHMSAPAPQLIRSSVDATCADAAPAAKSATLGLLEIGLLEIIGATVACSAAAVSTALAATGRR